MFARATRGPQAITETRGGSRSPQPKNDMRLRSIEPATLALRLGNRTEVRGALPQVVGGSRLRLAETGSSRPHTGAWIETAAVATAARRAEESPPHGGGDRNGVWMKLEFSPWVPVPPLHGDGYQLEPPIKRSRRLSDENQRSFFITRFLRWVKLVWVESVRCEIAVSVLLLPSYSRVRPDVPGGSPIGVSRRRDGRVVEVRATPRLHGSFGRSRSHEVGRPGGPVDDGEPQSGQRTDTHGPGRSIADPLMSPSRGEVRWFDARTCHSHDRYTTLFAMVASC